MERTLTLTMEKIDAANRLHEGLDQWRLADEALQMLSDRCCGFAPDACLLKVVAVNALYGTNVYATMRMAAHITAVVAKTDLTAAGADFVEQLAHLPPSVEQTHKRNHYSFVEICPLLRRQGTVSDQIPTPSKALNATLGSMNTLRIRTVPMRRSWLI